MHVLLAVEFYSMCVQVSLTKSVFGWFMFETPTKPQISKARMKRLIPHFFPFLLILSLKTPPLCRWVMLSIHVWLEQHCAIIILHWCTRPHTTLSWTSLLFPQYWAAPRWSNTELLLSLWLLENPHLSKYVLRYVCFYSISWVDVDAYTTV